MKRATGHDQFGLGHTTSSVALLAGYGAKALRLGDAEKHDTEKLTLPRQISFLKDINVSTALIISVIMLVAIASPRTPSSVSRWPTPTCCPGPGA